MIMLQAGRVFVEANVLNKHPRLEKVQKGRLADCRNGLSDARLFDALLDSRKAGRIGTGGVGTLVGALVV